jgi:hypothetical protein
MKCEINLIIVSMRMSLNLFNELCWFDEVVVVWLVEMERVTRELAVVASEDDPAVVPAETGASKEGRRAATGIAA